MENEKDKALFNEIGKVYDSSALIINDLVQEIATLETKYGTASKIVEKKRLQLAQLRALYDKTLNYINYLRELNHNMYTDFMMSELLRHQKETGLRFQNIATLAGWDAEKWKDVDKWEQVIRNAKVVLNVEDTDEFDTFIELIKK